MKDMKTMNVMLNLADVVESVDPELKSNDGGITW